MTLIELPELIRGSDIARFQKFVPTTDPAACWEWQSTRNRRGYGKFWLDRRTVLAHRVSYKIQKGEIPDGLMVRHTCDNPPCVNPAHLLVGTGKDNSRDAVERGRSTWGVRNGRAKLTDQEALDIKAGWLAGETQVSLARRFGVSRAAVQFVLNGRNWSHLSEAS